MNLPEVLARPPWPPARKRSVLSLVVAAREDRVVWADEHERDVWAHPGDAKDRKLEVWEREEILTKLQTKDIVRIDAIANLEMEDFIASMHHCDVRFIDHYGLARVALAKYGLGVLDAIFGIVEKAPMPALEALVHVDSLQVPARTTHEEVLRRWSLAHPTTAALAAIPLALGAEGKSRKAAVRSLVQLHREGHGDAIREAARAYGDDALVEIDALFAPEPLPSRAPTLPSFVHVEALPMVHLVDGSAIGRDALQRLAELASLLPLAAARDALATIRVACTAESLGAFARFVVDAWVEGGAQTKHKWALLAAGVLGDDIVARQLADWTVEWSREGLHPRARTALEALSVVGSDVALMHVDRIARAMKGALKANATATLDAIAKERGLSQDELGDRLVPSLGLDPDATTWLDFGARRFRVSFDETLAPELFDEAGLRIKRLPRPNESDDTTRAEHSLATYKGLVSDAKKIAPDQMRRLERAMCLERSWSVEEFHRFFIEHPLMLHIARRLVWVTATGATFRITEDRSFADQTDRSATLPDDQRIRIAHPIAIAPDVAAWSTLFGDYHIVQPFSQLGRESFTLTESETKTDTLRRFAGVKVPGVRFFSLRHRGWTFRDYALGKSVGACLAMLETEPGLDFLSSRPQDQVLGEISLYSGSHSPVTFGSLSAIEASELLRRHHASREVNEAPDFRRFGAGV